MPCRCIWATETPFSPAKKAHPCFVADDIDAVAEELRRKSYPVRWDDRMSGVRRFFSADPFGNRLEFMQG